MGRRVQGPDGRDWVVRRRWEPRLGPDSLGSRFRGRFVGTLRTGRRLAGSNDELKPGCFDPEGWIFLAVALAVLLLMVFVVAPIVIAVVDVLGLLVLAGVGAVGRVVFRRPWTVEARADDGTVLTWPVVGWRASGERAADVAELVASGVTPPLS